jgi:hypothetical protein
MPPAFAQFPLFSPLRALELGAMALLCACDPQASTAYVGEPLLTMSGSVELSSHKTEGTLRPALAFLNQSSGEIRIVDVEAEGEFPAGFTMHVYDPPPDSALDPIASNSADPPAAIAFITAVTASHPDTIEFAVNGETSVSPALCNGQPCSCPAEGCPRTQTRLCTNGGKACYTETVTCPRSDSPDQDCTTTYAGDASLKESPWKSFAGLSENYMIVYVPAALHAGAATALALGTTEALDKGYNLMSIRPVTHDEELEQENCAQSAATLALARFNQGHGTSYDALQIMGLTCASGTQCPPAASQAEIDAYSKLLGQVMNEQRCLATSFVSTRVDDPAHESISVRIGPGLEPFSQSASQAAPSSPLDPQPGP